VADRKAQGPAAAAAAGEAHAVVKAGELRRREATSDKPAVQAACQLPLDGIVVGLASCPVAAKPAPIGKDRASSFPDFSTFCQDACIKAWGEPNRRTKSELRWGDDSYNYRTYDVRKRAWYDAGAQCGGSTLELAEFRKGKPIKDLRGARFFEAWKDAFELEFVPDPPPQMNGGDKPIIATYPYTDEQGTLLYEVVRFDSTDPLERFKQRRPDGNGGWIWKTKGIRQVLFRLPQLIAAVKAGQRVLVCEGERDANTAAKLGYAATTNPGGVRKWKKDYDEFFRGTDVVVVSDNDANGEGQAHADSVARRLSKIAARVRLVMFPVKDLSQWADTGGTREQLDALIEQAAPIDKDHADTKEAGKEDYMAGKTNLASNVGNVLLALTQEPEIMNAFGYDEMLRTEVLLRPLFTNDPNFTVRPVTDADVCAVQAHLQWFGFRRLGKGATHEAIDKHARDHAFHPVRDYLEALHWDGIERVRTWLKTYLGAKQNKYIEGIGTMLLVGMVARVYEPGCNSTICQSSKADRVPSNQPHAPCSRASISPITCPTSPARRRVSTCAVNGSSRFQSCALITARWLRPSKNF
jgi:hypothetical protein